MYKPQSRHPKQNQKQIHIKAINYTCFKLDEKTTIKTTLSLLEEINLPQVLDEQNQ